MVDVKISKMTVVVSSLVLSCLVLGLGFVRQLSYGSGEDEMAYKEFVFPDRSEDSSPRFSLFTCETYDQFANVISQLEVLRKNETLSNAAIVTVRGLRLKQYAVLLYDPMDPATPKDVDYPTPWRSLEFAEDGTGTLRVYLIRNGKGLEYFIRKDWQYKPAAAESSRPDEWRDAARKRKGQSPVTALPAA